MCWIYRIFWRYSLRLLFHVFLLTVDSNTWKLAVFYFYTCIMCHIMYMVGDDCHFLWFYIAYCVFCACIAILGFFRGCVAYFFAFQMVCPDNFIVSSWICMIMHNYVCFCLWKCFFHVSCARKSRNAYVIVPFLANYHRELCEVLSIKNPFIGFVIVTV